MLFQEIDETVKSLSGVTDAATRKAAIHLAAEEVWNSLDIPGTMQEIRVDTGANRYVTLPWQVYKVRGIKNAYDRVPVEVNTIHPLYHDYSSFLTPGDMAVELGRIPLKQKITNASTLTFTLRKKESVDVVINIVGEVDNASRVIEPVTIPAGQLSAESVERFINLPTSITKTAVNRYDIDIADADGVVLGTIPNHLYSASYLLYQFRDRCLSDGTPLRDGFDIMFKPHLPPMTEGGDFFPAPYHQTVIFKALEQLKMGNESELDVATAYNSKGMEVTKQFNSDAVNGKTLRPNVRHKSNYSHFHGSI